MRKFAWIGGHFLGYSFTMRFHAKFGWIGWAQAINAVIWSTEWLFRGRSEPWSSEFVALLTLSVLLLYVTTYRFRYWEFRPEGLREHNFWKTRDVAWDELRHVQGRNAVPSAEYVELYAYRPPPMSESFRLIANPGKRDQFLAALRKFAPQAEYDV